MEAEELLGNFGEKAEGPKESPLVSLKEALVAYKKTLQEIAQEVLDEGVTSHPIFIAHQHIVSLGEIVIDKEEVEQEWSINISTLEEFVEKGIIQADKKDVFIYSYKDPYENACIFVIVPEGANFVFLPY